eukprot:1106506-Prorocentrum_lima.AAC.1
MEKFFTNPLGVASSVVGMIIFLTVLVSLIFFQPGVEVTVSYFSFLVVMSFYYFWVVESRQYFSEDEQKYFLRAYIVN